MSEPIIGVFDSGVGGDAVVKAIRLALPQAQVLYADDKTHLPYGNKSPQELLGFVLPKLKTLQDQGCQIIVVACNTVTTTLIDRLRQQLSVPLIGMEPMIKPAAQITKSKVIAVCATPTTLASPRYRQLKTDYAPGIQVLEPDCSDWAAMIESQQIDQNQIRSRIKAVLESGADVIVLGCTHYHWIENLIKQIVAGRAQVLQPEQPVIDQLRRELARLV